MLLKISNKSIGFDKEFSFLKDLFNNKAFPKAIMIKGISGIGKTRFVNHCSQLFAEKIEKVNFLARRFYQPPKFYLYSASCRIYQTFLPFDLFSTHYLSLPLLAPKEFNKT